METNKKLEDLLIKRKERLKRALEISLQVPSKAKTFASSFFCAILIGAVLIYLPEEGPQDTSVPPALLSTVSREEMLKVFKESSYKTSTPSSLYVTRHMEKPKTTLDYINLLKHDPLDSRAFQGLLQTLSSPDELDAYAKDLHHVPAFHAYQAYRQDQQGAVMSAIESAEIAVSLQPENEVYIFNLAALYDKQGDLSKSIQAYEKILDLGGSSQISDKAMNRVLKIRNKKIKLS